MKGSCSLSTLEPVGLELKEQHAPMEKQVGNKFSTSGTGTEFVDFPTECGQEYTVHKLVAIDTVTEEAQVDNFPLPSCCTCYKTYP